jgi:hypothetical protein
MEPSTIYRFAAPFPYGVLLWSLVAVGLILGLMVYVLLVYPRSRRAQFRDGKAVPRWIAAPAGAVLFLAIAAGAHRSLCAGFFALAIAGDRLEISYRFPDRSVTVPRDQVAAVREQLTLEKGDRRCLLIETTGGDLHESISFPAREVEKVRREVSLWREGKAR